MNRALAADLQPCTKCGETTFQLVDGVSICGGCADAQSRSDQSHEDLSGYLEAFPPFAAEPASGDRAPPRDAVKPWPVLDRAVFHGPAGQFALAADPHTEADPVAVLVTTLVGAGCALHRGTWCLAGNARHPASLFAVIVGATSKGAKGTSGEVASAALEAAAPTFMSERVLGGFGSGEAVVDEVRDPIFNSKGEVVDPGAVDKRLLIFESEFARLLRVASRDGSILSQTIRDGWDGKRLQTRSRGKTAVATGHHICATAHVTLEELRARLTDIETYGGFSNRWLFVLARRSKTIPEGGNVPTDISAFYGARLKVALDKGSNRGEVRRTLAAKARWAELYEEMTADEPGGLLGAVIARDRSQCLRLSLVYALLDESPAIDVEHVEAAWALWRYCRMSAELIFGSSLGHRNLDKLDQALREAGSAGLDGTEQRDLFNRHLSGDELERLRGELEQRGRAVTTAERDTAGRPRLRTIHRSFL